MGQKTKIATTKLHKIKKILIANRAEIACRIMSTCQEMDIATVAIYADNDRTLPFVGMSDESYCLGTGPLKQTYLNQDLIMQIALQAQVDAIHPGYGLLSENAQFCRKVNAAGLIFIGPSSEAMELMGDKKASKITMEKIGVPCVPGYHGGGEGKGPKSSQQECDEFLLAQAQRIGLPLLIKASAGGGGKGMRIVEEWEQFAEALRGARSEALKAFGSDEILLEKYLQRPRHIEIQVFGDEHGNAVHFFERECSIQRRYQKIVEESPSVAVNEQMREKMVEMALRIVRHLRYSGAGTIELILDESGEFYFLEMNTRLQVEHPVTEMITGVDLVRLQIEVAQGAPLPWRQEEITSRGHALEVRLYAEDPQQQFFPTTGILQEIKVPPFLRNVRLDFGYAAGNEVTVDYDPMLGKLIVWGKNRPEAIEKMLFALKQIYFLGVKTNRSYLAQILSLQDFRDGKTTTDFIPRHQAQLQEALPEDEMLALICAADLLTPASRQGGVAVVVGGLEAKNQPLAWDLLVGLRNVL